MPPPERATPRLSDLARLPPAPLARLVARVPVALGLAGSAADGTDGTDVTGLTGAGAAPARGRSATDQGCARCARLERRLERERTARLESESLAEEFSRRAMHDPVTGLGSRHLFHDQLVLALDRAARAAADLDGTGQVGLLLIDLDEFKLVNDTLGHGAGDRLLAVVGTRLNAGLRRGQVAARLGADEFAVLCEGTLDVDDLHALAEDLRTSLGEPVELDGHLWHPRSSIGICLASPGDTAAMTLRDADTAMHAAKHAGKDRTEVFRAQSRSRLVERVHLVTALREALDADRVETWFQPIVDLRTSAVIGAEALSRWHDAERGMVPPDQFIALAREIGEVGTIGTRVLAAACRQDLLWREHEGWVTHVNVHPQELDDPLLPSRTARALAVSGVSGDRICLEITEQTLVSDDPVVRENIGRLRDLGLGLAIDDFGVSYSSFAYLKRLPVTGLKVDRSFVTGVGSDHRDDAIVAAVVAMADALHLDVVAEGVETQAQAERLVELGVVAAQGWLFAPALPVERWAEAGQDPVAATR